MTNLREGAIFAPHPPQPPPSPPPLHPWADLKKTILYRVKTLCLLENLCVRKWLVKFLISLQMIAVFLIWPYSLVISRQSPAAKVRLVVKPTIIASLSACKKVAQSINSFLKYSINISPVFDHAHPKQLEVIFTCPEFVSTFEKSVYSFYSFFRYSQCWSPVSRVLKPTWPYPPKSFSINFNCHKFFFGTC